MLPLDTPLQFLKGVGPRRAADLHRVGLATIEDLLYRFPIRYEDRGTFQTRSSAPFMFATVDGAHSRTTAGGGASRRARWNSITSMALL